MAYIECPKCGQRALSVATRCPRCGNSFPTQFLRRSGSKPEAQRLRRLLVVAGALLAVVVVVVVLQRQAGPRAVAVPAPTAPHDTALPIPSQVRGEPSASAGDSSRSVVESPSGTPPPVGQQLQRYARTWVNVRGGRSPGAHAVRILSPGEAVLVDSLRQGWYRVLVDGRTLGYVYRSFLDAVPPPAHR